MLTHLPLLHQNTSATNTSHASWVPGSSNHQPKRMCLCHSCFQGPHCISKKRSQRIHVSQCQLSSRRTTQNISPHQAILRYLDLVIHSSTSHSVKSPSIHGFSFTAAMLVRGRRCCLTSLVHAACLLPIARHISSHQRDSTRPFHVPCKGNCLLSHVLGKCICLCRSTIAPMFKTSCLTLGLICSDGPKSAQSKELP